MKSRLPTPGEIDQLVSYLPRLYANGFKAVKQWMGGSRDSNGNLTLPYPEYDELVDEFFRVASNECWLDYEYIPEESARMLHDHELIKTASLAEIKSMLTFCVRGERFSDGHREEMIEGGHIRRLLERLKELNRANK